MPSVSTPSDAYQNLEDIRERVDYHGTDFFDNNSQLQFDQLLVRLEEESRGIFKTLWGDQTPLEETDRQDVKRATDDAALPMPYPVRSVSKVEVKHNLADDWETLEENRYDHTAHRLILAERQSARALRRSRRTGNPLTRNATRATWADLAAKVRVTYDRGFAGGAPSDVKSIQVQLVNQMLRKLKREQTVAAASPEEFAGQTETNEVLTDEIRERIADVTRPGRATQSI